MGGYLVLPAVAATQLRALGCVLLLPFSLHCAVLSFASIVVSWVDISHVCRWILIMTVVVVLRFRRCVDVMGGGSYWGLDTAVSCESERFRRFAYTNGVFLACYASLPLAWLWLLWRRRGKLYPAVTAAGGNGGSGTAVSVEASTKHFKLNARRSKQTTRH